LYGWGNGNLGQLGVGQYGIGRSRLKPARIELELEDGTKGTCTANVPIQWYAYHKRSGTVYPALGWSWRTAPKVRVPQSIQSESMRVVCIQH
jgi:Regulator of chromosome condensation (RCC1) repeat